MQRKVQVLIPNSQEIEIMNIALKPTPLQVACPKTVFSKKDNRAHQIMLSHLQANSQRSSMHYGRM